DMIERLPTPWGLVRLGVAPDHPKLKSVSRAFERIAEKPGFRFFGNVDVGRDLSHADLLELYDAVVYAFGAQTDKRLGIPGEELAGSWSATEFVAWYNGHPDYQELPFDLGVARAVVLGEAKTQVQRNMDVLREFAAREPTGKPCVVRFLFFRSPVAIHGDERVEAVELVRNRLEERGGRLVAVPTEEHETLACGLVFRSVG